MTNNDKNYIVRFFESFSDNTIDEIGIGKIEDNSRCIYVEFHAREFKYSIKDRELTLANSHMHEILTVNENYDVEIFYDSWNYYPFSIAFWKKK